MTRMNADPGRRKIFAYLRVSSLIGRKNIESAVRGRYARTPGDSEMHEMVKRRSRLSLFSNCGWTLARGAQRHRLTDGEGLRVVAGPQQDDVRARPAGDGEGAGDGALGQGARGAREKVKAKWADEDGRAGDEGSAVAVRGVGDAVVARIRITAVGTTAAAEGVGEAKEMAQLVVHPPRPAIDITHARDEIHLARRNRARPARIAGRPRGDIEIDLVGPAQVAGVGVDIVLKGLPRFGRGTRVLAVPLARPAGAALRRAADVDNLGDIEAVAAAETVHPLVGAGHRRVEKIVGDAGRTGASDGVGDDFDRDADINVLRLTGGRRQQQREEAEKRSGVHGCVAGLTEFDTRRVEKTSFFSSDRSPWH